MKLSAAEIRSVATGVLEMEEETGGVRLYRMTKAQRSWYDAKNPPVNRAHSMAGVTLDFYTDSASLTLACSGIWINPNYHCTFDLLVDGERWTFFRIHEAEAQMDRAGETAFRHVFRLPEGEKRVTLYFPAYKMRIDEVSLDDGAVFRPHQHKLNWLVFGDSITEGREPTHSDSPYINRVARRLDAQVYNQAISGEMFRVGKIMPGSYPACDFVTVAYGTNDFRKQEAELLLPTVAVFFRELVAEFPDVPIVYFLPVWRSDKDRITRGRTLEEVIPLLRKEAERWPQITVVDCWDFIPHEEGYFFDARLHPNDEGAACQAEGVYRAVARRLGIDV